MSPSYYRSRSTHPRHRRSRAIPIITLIIGQLILLTVAALPGEHDSSIAVAAAAADAAASSNHDIELDAYDDEELDEEYVEINVTAEPWKYLGSPCDTSCNPSLQHVFCDPQTKFCECEKLYPVQLGPTKGCAKPKKLGEQCLYRASCVYTDQHSTCTQVQHNAMCECETGYHRVPLSRQNKKLFCAADLVLIATDLPTLLGVATGIAVLTGLICFVLKLFSRGRYTRPRHYANAGHAAPMLFSSDTGIPLTLHGCRPSSRSSQRGSGATINCVQLNRKASSSGGGGGGASGGSGERSVQVSSSRAGAARAAAILLISCRGQDASGVVAAAAAAAGSNGKHRRALSDVAEGSSDGLGSRRPSLASIHSTTSSAKSYGAGARRLERERTEKEQRQALAEFKLKQQQQQQQQKEQPQPQPAPSPRTPHSTDELLPAVAEGAELFYNEQIPTTSGTPNAAAATKARMTTTKMLATTSEASSPLFESDVKPCTSADVYRSS